MALWTISWQAGSGGEKVARLLADRAGVPLVDLLSPGAAPSQSEKGARVTHLAPWVSDLALAAAPVFFFPVAEEVIARPSPRERVESMILEAGRTSCVVADCSAFAILADHRGACHVRIRAPLEWRIGMHARENCLSWEASRRTLLNLDRQRNDDVRRAYGRTLESAENFTVICDLSRLRLDDLVEVLLIAGRRRVDQLV